MSKQIFYRNLVVLGFAIWFITSAIFGWQVEPKNGVDDMFSTLGVVLIVWGILGDLSSNLTFTKSTNIKTESVVVNTSQHEPTKEIEG